MDFLLHAMGDIPETRDSCGAKNENDDNEDEQNFDKGTAAGFRRSGGHGLRGRYGRSGLGCGLRALRWRGTGNGWRWCCGGADGRTRNWRSAFRAKSLSIVQGSATIPAKTSHFHLRREAWIKCVLRVPCIVPEPSNMGKSELGFHNAAELVCGR